MHASISSQSFQSNIPLKTGDIIFHVSQSTQSRAIQMATKSKYSHVGMIQIINGKYFVYEAVQPVKFTKLEDWIKRGENGHYVVKRLKNSNTILTPANTEKLISAGEKYKGKNYDLYFEWTDDRIYCSELVWKIYKEALDIEIGTLQELKDFDLTNSVVKEKITERYGDNVPLREKVISPAAIFESDLLQTVVIH
jgi:uncharacterized protein YycO